MRGIRTVPPGDFGGLRQWAGRRTRGRLVSPAAEIAATLAAHRTPEAIVDGELSQMRGCRVAPTANRSVVGIMNEFSFLADVYRRNDPGLDLLQLAKRLAATPCSPLYRRHTSPDRELQAYLQSA